MLRAVLFSLTTFCGTFSALGNERTAEVFAFARAIGRTEAAIAEVDRSIADDAATGARAEERKKEWAKSKLEWVAGLKELSDEVIKTDAVSEASKRSFTEIENLVRVWQLNLPQLERERRFTPAGLPVFGMYDLYGDYIYPMMPPTPENVSMLLRELGPALLRMREAAEQLNRNMERNKRRYPSEQPPPEKKKD